MTGFDWLALLQVGVQGLRMTPEDFWKLTPAELRLMLGQAGAGPTMTRGGLDALLAAYSPCHLTAVKSQSGDIDVNWIRRTRTEGDSWDLSEVPLGEEAEAYLVRVWQGMEVVRELSVHSPHWTYSAGMQAADDLVSPIRIEVGQISARYGFGLFSSVGLKE